MTSRDLAGREFDRLSFDSLLRRRLFYTEAFEIYRTASTFVGDNRGLYDYGPPGCGLQANIVEIWRKHFVLEEDMLEVDCTVLTPEEVFKTSGHVDKFADWMCKDVIKGDFLRADHLVESVLKARLDRASKPTPDNHQIADDSMSIKSKTSTRNGPVKELDPATAREYEGILAKIDNYDGPELGEIIKRLNIRNPDGDNEVLPPVSFNLMFKSSIGPSSAAPVYLRPETAQGQFLNFRKLLEYNQNAMPFASASIGKSYRNEISPRSGLLRVREFLLAEIEHFVDPQGGKQHSKFDEVRDIELSLLDRDTQLAGQTETKQIPIGNAVKDKTIDNETLGYFLARIHMFLLTIGIDKSKLRFRQHMPNEMAHYACDCWDAELLTSYGWIECVGCADRSAYDLTVHMQRTGEKLVVREQLQQPRTIIEWQAKLDKKLSGRALRQDAKIVENALHALDQDSLSDLAQQLHANEKVSIALSGLKNDKPDITLGIDMLTIEQTTRIENVREYTPNVIEPSFGIGRILYCLLEHVYWQRVDDAARGVLSLPPSVAPTKVLVVPLTSDPALIPIAHKLSQKLRSRGITVRLDNTGASIGKKYARNDELGTPLGITIDFDTIKDDSVTLRERDSMKQIRSSQEEIVSVVQHLVDGSETWDAILEKLPQYSAGTQETEEETGEAV